MTFNSTFTTGLGYTPLFRIDRNGQDITSNFEDRAISVRIDHRYGEGSGSSLDLMLDDRDWQIASPPTIGEHAASLDVFLGFQESGLVYQGHFNIHRVSYLGMPKSIRLTGNSVPFETNGKAPVIGHFEGQTLAQIVGAIAQSMGLAPAIDSGLGGIVIPYLNQNSSGLHLLQDLEKRFNGVATFDNGKLSFTRRGSGLTASGASFGTFTLLPEDLASWSIEENQRSTYAKVRASYWDKARHEPVWITSTIPGLAGSTIPYLLKTAFASEAEAQAAADATMAASNRSFRRGSITLAKGNPMIQAGMRFSIDGMRDGINGDAYMGHSVTHIFTRGEGLVTSIEFHTEESPERDMEDVELSAA